MKARINSAKKNSPRHGLPGAILKFLKRAQLGSVAPRLRQSQKSFKEEIAELRDKDISALSSESAD